MLPPWSARPDQLEHALKARYHDAVLKLQPERRELDLLIAILPDNNGSLYGIFYLLFCLISCCAFAKTSTKLHIYKNHLAYSHTTFKELFQLLARLPNYAPLLFLSRRTCCVYIFLIFLVTSKDVQLLAR